MENRSRRRESSGEDREGMRRGDFDLLVQPVSLDRSVNVRHGGDEFAGELRE